MTLKDWLIDWYCEKKYTVLVRACTNYGDTDWFMRCTECVVAGYIDKRSSGKKSN